MIYRWLKHNAFSANQSRPFQLRIIFPWLKIIFGYFDLRPNLKKAKIKLFKKAKGSNLPKIGYIHVPKTGGSYVASLESDFPHISFSHVVVRTDRSDKWCPIGLTPIHPKKIEGYYIFATVRNPLLMLISYYHHVLGNEGFNKSKHLYDYDVANKGFEHFVNTIITREDKWPSKKFLFPNLFDQEGRIVVDWVNRNETLDLDLKKLLNRFDLQHQIKERKRVAKKRVNNEYYSKELLEKVCKVYAREMKIFGYDGYKIIDPLAELKNFKSSNIKYLYSEDKVEGLTL